ALALLLDDRPAGEGGHGEEDEPGLLPDEEAGEARPDDLGGAGVAVGEGAAAEARPADAHLFGEEEGGLRDDREDQPARVARAEEVEPVAASAEQHLLSQDRAEHGATPPGACSCYR